MFVCAGVDCNRCVDLEHVCDTLFSEASLLSINLRMKHGIMAYLSTSVYAMNAGYEIVIFVCLM